MDEDDEEEEEEEEDDENNAVLVQEEKEEELHRTLAVLGWPAGLLRWPLRAALQSATRCAIMGVVAGNFKEEGLLESVLRRQRAVLLPWVRGVVGPVAFWDERWEAALEVQVSRRTTQPSSATRPFLRTTTL